LGKLREIASGPVRELHNHCNVLSGKPRGGEEGDRRWLGYVNQPSKLCGGGREIWRRCRKPSKGRKRGERGGVPERGSITRALCTHRGTNHRAH